MPQVAVRTATRDEDAGRYQRHQTEQSLLYRIVEEYYPAFAGHLVERGSLYPKHSLRSRDRFSGKS